MRFIRYFVASMGIIIGMSVLMLVLGVAEGGRAVLADNLWSKGVRAYDIKLENMSLGSDEYLQRSDGRLLTEKMSEVKDSIPVLKLEAQLKSYKAAANAFTLAVNEKYQYYANLEVVDGRFINGQDVSRANKIVLIDDMTAVELYGTKAAVGQRLELQVGGKAVEFVIAGVIKNFNRNIETLFEDEYPGLCLIPESVPEEVSFQYRVEKLVALVDKRLHKEEAASMLSRLLEREYDRKGVFVIEEYDQLSYVSEFTDKYLVFAVITAIVGLISGGIGIMNAMLLTVQERKKELVLYKLYGSGIRDIQYDILFKALVICQSFGALGMLLGIAAAGFAGSFVNITPVFTLTIIFITIASSAAIGILSGLYPAYRARMVDVSEQLWEEG